MLILAVSEVYGSTHKIMIIFAFFLSLQSVHMNTQESSVWQEISYSG